MQYMGGKARISKWVSSVLNDLIHKYNIKRYIEPFCGSCNVTSKVVCETRIASDISDPLIRMWKNLQEGMELPDSISEDEYHAIKNDYYHKLHGFVGFGCSFSGRFYEGYARCKSGRNYCLNAKNTTLKKLKTLGDVIFDCADYSEVLRKYITSEGSLVYCDIPYKNTKGYGVHFDHDEFYDFIRLLSAEGHIIIVSEYLHNVPQDAKILATKESKTGLRRKSGVQNTVEVLFTFNDINI
jgi:DNA adenine methylase